MHLFWPGIGSALSEQHSHVLGRLSDRRVSRKSCVKSTQVAVCRSTVRHFPVTATFVKYGPSIRYFLLLVFRARNGRLHMTNEVAGTPVRGREAAKKIS